ncbi:MAG: aminotransferase class III-fold pyridoxal phosphate-dependent enzyme, partial [Rhodospirillaceae bacterium]
ATMAVERVAAAMTAGSHGATFGGNPLAMAVANAVLDVILADGFLDHVSETGTRLRAGLEDLVAKYPKLFAEVRGQGLMLGLRCTDAITNGDVVGKATARGLLTVPAGANVVRFVPPLTIEATHVDEALQILDASAAEMAAEAS